MSSPQNQSRPDSSDKPKQPYQATFEETQSFLESILSQISSRFTKKYLPPIENALQESYFFIPVEFFERKNKLPVPEYKVVLIFKVGRSLVQSDISFQIENEAVSFPVFDSLNLKFFESLLDRILLDKYKSSKALHLQTNFEHTRILNLNGENKKLFTIEEDENIFSNNASSFYAYEGIEFQFTKLEVAEIDKLIKIIWKTLVADNSVYTKPPQVNPISTGEENNVVKEKEKEETMTYDKFQLLFKYGKFDISEESMLKLWKYTNKKNNPTITYEEFVNFAITLIHCMRAYTTAKYKHDHNNCFDLKIKKCVEIMNLHFKDYDEDNNQEISFENLKKCLLKENELFTRKEIEIILQQINPEINFQYWKFDKILSILYNKYFDYQKLMTEDKIYKYLISIFAKQDPYKEGKLHYKKMKQAFLTENKIKFDKTEILSLLIHFNITTNPEIQYYEASLILRNIVEYLNSSEIGMQKIDITQPKYMSFENYEDDYDKYCREVKEIFIRYDKDFDHLLNKEEFKAFLIWLVPYLTEEEQEEVFNRMDTKHDDIIDYQEFKAGFQELMERTRIRNVIKDIKTIC